MWDVDDVCPGIAADGGDTVLGGVEWCVITSFNWRSPEVLCVNMCGAKFFFSKKDFQFFFSIFFFFKKWYRVRSSNRIWRVMRCSVNHYEMSCCDFILWALRFVLFMDV